MITITINDQPVRDAASKAYSVASTVGSYVGKKVQQIDEAVGLNGNNFFYYGSIAMNVHAIATGTLCSFALPLTAGAMVRLVAVDFEHSLGRSSANDLQKARATALNMRDPLILRGLTLATGTSALFPVAVAASLARKTLGQYVSINVHSTSE